MGHRPYEVEPPFPSERGQHATELHRPIAGALRTLAPAIELYSIRNLELRSALYKWEFAPVTCNTALCADGLEAPETLERNGYAKL